MTQIVPVPPWLMPHLGVLVVHRATAVTTTKLATPVDIGRTGDRCSVSARVQTLCNVGRCCLSSISAVAPRGIQYRHGPEQVGP